MFCGRGSKCFSRAPKRYQFQNNTSSSVTFFFGSIPYKVKAPAVDTQRDTKTAFLTPERYNKQPRHFYIGVLPRARTLFLQFFLLFHVKIQHRLLKIMQSAFQGPNHFCYSSWVLLLFTEVLYHILNGKLSKKAQDATQYRQNVTKLQNVRQIVVLFYSFYCTS